MAHTWTSPVAQSGVEPRLALELHVQLRADDKGILYRHCSPVHGQEKSACFLQTVSKFTEIIPSVTYCEHSTCLPCPIQVNGAALQAPYNCVKREWREMGGVQSQCRGHSLTPG